MSVSGPQAAVTPMIDDLPLPLPQQIATHEAQSLVVHPIPGLAGNLTQRLGRATTQVTLAGVIDQDQAGAALDRLRAKFQAAQPVSFVADIMTATQVQQMLISRLVVQSVAGPPDRFGYQVTLSEYVPPPPVETTTVDVADEAASLTQQQVDEIQRGTGTLTVRVEQVGSGNLDDVSVLVEGTSDAGDHISQALEAQPDGTYRRDNLPSGDYTVRVVRGQ